MLVVVMSCLLLKSGCVWPLCSPLYHTVQESPFKFPELQGLYSAQSEAYGGMLLKHLVLIILMNRNMLQVWRGKYALVLSERSCTAENDEIWRCGGHQLKQHLLSAGFHLAIFGLVKGPNHFFCVLNSSWWVPQASHPKVPTCLPQACVGWSTAPLASQKISTREAQWWASPNMPELLEWARGFAYACGGKISYKE